jgi:hypothetical protein
MLKNPTLWYCKNSTTIYKNKKLMMKRLKLFLFFTLFSLVSFSQTKFNVWDKKPQVAKTVTKIKSTKLPKTFESELPDGTTEIYDKIEVQTIQFEQSDGKKFKYKPVTYSGRKNLSIITYDGDKWEGFHHKKDGKSYKMAASVISEDTSSIQLQVSKSMCGTLQPPSQPTPQKAPGMSDTPTAEQLIASDYYNPTIPINKTVTVYIEISYSLYTSLTNQGQNVNTWVNNLFQSVSKIYQNEGITIVLNKVYVWTTPIPVGYNYDTDVSSSGNVLSTFTSKISQNLPTTPNAHFKHLLTNSNYGGIAWKNGNANGYNNTSPNLNPTYTCAVSGMSITSLPLSNGDISNYNWPIYVFSHELGHNLGSNHTHNCNWYNESNQLIGRLDSCYGGESGSCGSLTSSSAVPSIMSYCHLRSNRTNILSNGFRKYPRWAIRQNLDRAAEIPYNSNVSVPTVTTISVSSITRTTAISGGNVTSAGGGTIITRGVCWAVSPAVPTTSNFKTTDGSAAGVFTSNLTNLTAGTTYILRSYATNSAGTSYGPQITFTTSPAVLPTVSTTSMTSITQTSATSGGSISDAGGVTITAKGVCWSTSPNPTVSLTTKTNNGTGITSFVSSLTSLTLSTTYYVRAYATNSVGTAYGNEISFNTLAASLATITTSTPTAVTSSSVTLGGNITNTGGTTVTERGICYATTQNPTVSNTKVVVGSGGGTFSTTVSGLQASTTYYVRAYAINSVGTTYGSQVSFSTSSTPTGSSCLVSNLVVTRISTMWNFSFNPNPNCRSYTVNVCRYSNANPSVPPTIGQSPTACAIRNNMSSYVPTTSEISSNLITRRMSPQPSFRGFWYSVDVTCNSTTCTGSKTTRSAYFYHP